MTHKQTLHLLQMLLITILSTHTIYASTISDITISDITSLPTEVGTHITIIPTVEYEKIQEIECSMAHMSMPQATKERMQYIYDELEKAVRSKHLNVIDHLLDLNFATPSHIITNSHIACITGISAARGDLEDVAIIEKILNAKQTAFNRSNQVDMAPRHGSEMIELLNKTLAASALQGHRHLVSHILMRTHDIRFDTNGIDWALTNTMHIQNTLLRHQIISDLYFSDLHCLFHARPSLSGTIDALEIALDKSDNSGYDSDWFNILELAVTQNNHTIEDILTHTTLSTRSIIVQRLVDRMQSNACPAYLMPDVKSKILVAIKLKGEYQNEAADKIKASLDKIKTSLVPHGINPKLVCSANCDLIKHIFELWEKECGNTILPVTFLKE